MGTNPGLFRKEIRFFAKAKAAIGAAALIFIFAAAATALAQTPTTPSANVWKPGECALAGGVADGTDCYTKEVPSPIMISVGGAVGTTTLTQYISEFYKLLTAGAAVLAVIYLMIGGFQIMASAGGENVGEGRKKIANAILGLALVFCSYVLLQTVNPALVNLQAPRIKLVRSNYLNLLSGTNIIGEDCDESDAARVTLCKNSCSVAGLTANCVCEGGKCTPVAVNSLAAGNKCTTDHPGECVAPAQCISTSSTSVNGICVTGELNTACVTDHNPTTCVNSLNCCDAGGGAGVGVCLPDCSKRALGMNCQSNDQCESKSCVMSTVQGKPVCTAKAVGQACNTNDDCTAGLYCPTQLYDFSPGGSSPNHHQCSTLVAVPVNPGDNGDCCSNSECLTGKCFGAPGGLCRVQTDKCLNCGTCTR